MADTTIQKFTLYQLTGANAYAAMLVSQTAAATSATNAAASAASAASAVNNAVSGTVNKIAKFTGANSVGNSAISDDGTSLVYDGQNFLINNNSPASYIRKLNAPTNQKIWRTYVVDAQIVFDITNDAFEANQTYYTVQRSGASVTAQQWFIAGNERFSFNDSTLFARTAQYQLGYGAGAGVQVELGSARTTDNYSLVDFHSIAGGATDYEARIIRWGGANGAFEFINTGAGAIGFINIGAGDISFSTTNTTRMRIYADGGVQIGGTFGTSPGTGKLRVETALNVGTNQVVSARDTGWTAMTGTANKNTAYDTASVTLAQLAGRVMSLQAALTTHGLIGA